MRDRLGGFERIVQGKSLLWVQSRWVELIPGYLPVSEIRGDSYCEVTVD